MCDYVQKCLGAGGSVARAVIERVPLVELSCLRMDGACGDHLPAERLELDSGVFRQAVPHRDFFRLAQVEVLAAASRLDAGEIVCVEVAVFGQAQERVVALIEVPRIDIHHQVGRLEAYPDVSAFTHVGGCVEAAVWPLSPVAM
ncbi:MAG: hypothetical protein P8J20_17295 [Novosphingobium sp.]|nr:hypothetical protein [Novosphingobium sp.]